ncbi:MAG: chemotaxis protein CheW [Desulfobacteraceae bacterium]|nr:chemotaxis protein CheW [Desulfobacteraceae bacterium]
MEKAIIFQTGNAKFALDTKYVNLIQPIDTLCTTDARWNGYPIANYNGKNLVIIDLAKHLNQGAANLRLPEAKALLTKTSPPLAIIADQIEDILTLEQDQTNELPALFQGKARTFFSFVLRIKGQLAMVLNPQAIIASCCQDHFQADKQQQCQSPIQKQLSSEAVAVQKNLCQSEFFQNSGTTKNSIPDSETYNTMEQSFSIESVNKQKVVTDPVQEIETSLESNRLEIPKTDISMQPDKWEDMIANSIEHIIERRIQKIVTQTVFKSLKRHFKQIDLLPAKPFSATAGA